MPYLVNMIELLDVFINYTGNQTRNRRFILHKTIREFKTLSIAGACFEMWPVRLLERKLAELPAKLREAAIYPI